MMLCLKCGEREQYGENLCEECLLGSIQFFDHPLVVHGKFCPACGKVLKGKTWEESPGDDEAAAISVASWKMIPHEELKSMKLELYVDYHNGGVMKVVGRGSGVYKGLTIHRDISVEVRMTSMVCVFCSKKHGNYFEAIIQLRGLDGLDEDQVYELLDSIRDQTFEVGIKDPNVFITKEEKVRGGWDIYMGEKAFAKNLSMKFHSRYGGEMKSTSSLYGRKDGRDLYRNTYLVRFPGFLLGDYLVMEDGPKQITKILSKNVGLRDLGSGQMSTMDQVKAMTRRVVSAKEANRDLVVVMETATEIQVLHPDSLKPVDLIKPDDYEREKGDTVSGVQIDQDLYLT